MPRHFVKACAYLAVATATWWPCAVALAQPHGLPDAANLEKVRLQYRAPVQCPDETSFVELVRKRLTTDWEPSPGELARPIAIVVAKVGDDYVATAEFLTAQGRRLARAVRGRDCREVVNGIALVTALAIQSRVDQVLDESQPIGAGAEESATKTRVAAPPPAMDAVTVPGVEPIPPWRVSSSKPIAPGAPSEQTRLPISARVSVRAALATGVGPKTMPGVALGAVIEHGVRRLGLTLQGFWSGRIVASGYAARFGLLAARVEGCPIAVNYSGAIGLEPCLFVEAGVLSGQGVRGASLDISDGGSSPWLAAGIVGRVTGSLGRVVVELEAAGRFPLRHEEFYVDQPAGNPPQTVHEVPIFVLSGAMGAGVRF